MLSLFFNNNLINSFLKLIYVIGVTLVASTFTYGQNGQGAISGTVKDTLGNPVSHAAVSVKGVSNGTYTDQNGSFKLNNVQEGYVTIIIQLIGYETIEKNIEVKSGEIVSVGTLVLKEDVSVLETVEIAVNRNKFAKKESDQVSRLPLKNMENPQVYNVVGKSLMTEQIVTERTDVYRNVPGAVPNFSAGGSQGLTMRGFSNTNGMRNGMVTSAVYPLNPVILERIEFLKGPSGTLFGGNRSTTFGGVYNYVTKKPYEGFGGELSYTAGSFAFSRIAADINTPLNKEQTALFRLNAGWQSEGSFQDQGFAKNYAFAPSFSYQVNKKLKFSIDADFTRTNYTTTSTAIPSLAKVTARNFKDLQLDYKRSYTNENVDVETGLNNIGAQIDYKLSDKWKSETKFLYSVGYYKHLYWTTLSLLTDSTAIRQVRNQTPETFGNIQVQQNFVGDFKIGSFRNRMVVGIDYNNTYNSLNRVTVNYDTININKPLKDFNTDKLNNLSAGKFVNSTFKSESYGLYVSDVFNITPSLMAMLSLRLDRYTTKGSYSPSTGVYADNSAYEQTSLAPKLGLVYQPVKDKVSLFANYMSGFTNLGPVQQPGGEILKLDPQYGTQWEVGTKVDVIENKLSGSVSYYNIAVTNSTYSVAGTTFQDGTQNSKGFEVELIANPVAGLNIIAGYGNNENKYTKASAALEGKSVMASPKHVANIWVSYRLMRGTAKGLGVGVGGNYVADSWFEPTNSFVLPSYTLLNAAIFYDQRKYRLSVKGNNLLDQKYWNATGMPQKPVNFLASVTLKF